MTAPDDFFRVDRVSATTVKITPSSPDMAASIYIYIYIYIERERERAGLLYGQSVYEAQTSALRLNMTVDFHGYFGLEVALINLSLGQSIYYLALSLINPKP